MENRNLVGTLVLSASDIKNIKKNQGVLVSYLLDLVADAFANDANNKHEIQSDVSCILSASEYDIGKGDRIALKW